MVDFDICIHVWNHHQSHINEHTLHHQKFPCDPLCPLPSGPDNQSTICFLLLLINLHFLEFYIHAVLQDALFFLSKLILRFTMLLHISRVCFSLLLSNYRNVPQFAYPFTCWRTSGLFPVFHNDEQKLPLTWVCKSLCGSMLKAGILCIWLFANLPCPGTCILFI